MHLAAAAPREAIQALEAGDMVETAKASSTKASEHA